MSFHKKSKCEECGKTVGVRTGCKTHGHFLCGHCKRKTQLPNLWARLHPEPSISKKFEHKGFIRGSIQITRPEAFILFGKHLKQGMSEEQTKNFLSEIKHACSESHAIEKARVQQEEPLAFQKAFTKLRSGQK
jgi:hypothetical protein